MTPFNMFLVVLGSFSLILGAVGKAPTDEHKSFLGGMMVFGIIVLGIAMWRIS